MKIIDGFRDNRTTKSKVLDHLPDGEPIVSMVRHNEHIFIATSKTVYRFDPRDDELVRLKFIMQI